jgi:hypothetical protein
MAYRPFLSHKREDAAELEMLKSELCLRGAGGWQDVEELRMGRRFNRALVKAIRNGTGGFIWYATKKTLDSRIIVKKELPAALKRARRDDGSYPLVPLFVELTPSDYDLIVSKLGKRRADTLLDYNGLVRAAGEELALFHKRAARRYIRDLVRGHREAELKVAIVGGRPPSGEHDLSLDWRGLLDDDGRLSDQTMVPTLIETLTDIRDALHETTECPHIVVQAELRLPLGALVGWEWNRVRSVKLTVVQPGQTPLVVGDVRRSGHAWPPPTPTPLGGDGPAVIAVAVGKDIDEGVRAYASAQSACEVTYLHVPVDGRPGQALAADDICELAQWTINRLAEANSRGLERHLIILGPVSLAIRVGAGANGTGKTFVPFWNGSSGYRGGVLIG